MKARQRRKTFKAIPLHSLSLSHVLPMCYPDEAMFAAELQAALAFALSPCSTVVKDCAKDCKRRAAQCESLPSQGKSTYKAVGEEDCQDAPEIPGLDTSIVEFERQQKRLTTVEEFAKLARDLGLKHCPQCHNACMKEDENSCDHIVSF